ncbi:MAG TPA: hypothetical protein DEB73_01650 [Candidatus Magasanikbacteria bacterium]|uniref:Uncharacterized protein n=2 Tax=Candidatus Magasanikiibacteriota TaxID=1752731 RepID=A0A0G0WKC0_9BACT|nr:MAG: hypothetical protein UU49_C0002G0011 [Candidatus Magasanikbacteria bacterium GW2011_GWC2_41_17]KKS13275.1 MAG: hypothetical protein UU69_C0009G0010 [Candidatus Magasanikbacteria bacterium GW2011_GWA2_41_55]HBV57950.1 hypothetical protein [Candidatus Magasanikbacteria bacterium]HBX15711.1 hypothetical protein [Candidatus Magasanikbacteria bacterium]
MFKINLKKYFDKNVSKPELMARLTFYCILLIISSTFIIFLFFLYQRFYLTLIQAEEIVILKSQLAVDVLDIDLYQKVKSTAENRKNAPVVNWQEVRNPFPAAPVAK